jgi:diadenosine tetraphosphate (Ap4A) HIT family hydrolase
MIGKVDRMMKEKHGADSFNLGLNDGPAAGQTVPHLHLHVVPRKTGDVTHPRGGIRNFLPDPLVEYPSG